MSATLIEKAYEYLNIAMKNVIFFLPKLGIVWSIKIIPKLTYFEGYPFGYIGK